MVKAWILSFIYVMWGHVACVTSIFDNLKAVVLAIVLSAVLRIGKKALKNEVMRGVAAAAFVAIFFCKLPFPLIIAAAAVIGFVGSKFFPSQFQTFKTHSSQKKESLVLDEIMISATPSFRRALYVCITYLSLWLTPLLLVRIFLGADHVLFQEGMFFSKAALVTFGGAYSVLPYVSQQAVQHYHWLAPGQMLDGLGLAETTPGPLIIVLQFVSFLGAWKTPFPFSPWVAATLGAAITTWVTFIPCFLWVFLGAPYIEKLRRNTNITAVLSAITAAVVGVVLNLAVWFGRNILFPVGHPFNWCGICIAALAFYAIYRWKWGGISIIGAAAALGVLRWFIGL